MVGLGLVVIPIRQNKKPHVACWQHAVLADSLRWIEEFPKANIALLCGKRSGITVIDVDEPGDFALREALAFFGETPLIARTPRGGHHLYYRHSGEPRYVKYEKRSLDILGEGCCVMPPSKTRTGDYQWILGDSAKFSELPHIQCERLGMLQTPAKKGAIEPKNGRRDNVSKGHRNRWLFDSLRTVAKTENDQETLGRTAQSLNQTLDQPLPGDEVRTIAQSVWKYKSEGRLMAVGQASVVALPSQWAFDLSAGALKLLVQMKSVHGAKKGSPFFMTYQSKDFYGLSLPSLRKYLSELESRGFIEFIERGVKGQRHATRLRLLK